MDTKAYKRKRAKSGLTSSGKTVIEDIDRHIWIDIWIDRYSIIQQTKETAVERKDKEEQR